MNMVTAKAALAATLLIVAAESPACAQSRDKADKALTPEQQLVEGRATFRTYCQICHGRDGRGNGPMAIELRTPPPALDTLKKRYGGEFPETYVASMIDGRHVPASHGTREMPIWGDWFTFQARAGGLLDMPRKDAEAVARQRIANIVVYLRSIQK